MIARILICLTVMVSLVSVAAHADEAERLDRLFEASRMQDVHRGIPEAILEGLLDGKDAFVGDIPIAEIEALAHRHLGAATLTNDLRKRMAGRLPLADIETVLAFFRSDLGTKVADLEASAALEDTDHIEAVGAPLYLTIKEWNPERARQIDLMIELLSEVEWATRTTMNLWYAFLTALYAGPVGDGGMTDSEILAYLNEMGLGLRSQVDLYLKADYSFTYNELSDAELETYLGFLRSEPGLSFFSEYRESFAEVVEDRARAFASEYRLLVRQKRS